MRFHILGRLPSRATRAARAGASPSLDVLVPWTFSSPCILEISTPWFENSPIESPPCGRRPHRSLELDEETRFVFSSTFSSPGRFSPPVLRFSFAGRFSPLDVFVTLYWILDLAPVLDLFSPLFSTCSRPVPESDESDESE